MSVTTPCLNSWKTDTSKPHLFAEPLATLNAFVLLCVSEECCLLETNRKLKVCFLGEEIRAHKEDYMGLLKVERGMKRLE